MDEIKIKVNREDVEAMLKSTKPKDHRGCQELRRAGFMRFTGNQHNEKWDWEMDKLREEYPTTQLLHIFYLGVKQYNQID